MSIVHNHSLSNEDKKFEIQLNCCKLEQAESVKLLGLEFDEQLFMWEIINAYWHI